MMRRLLIAILSTMAALALLAGPAAADHDHRLLTPGGCVTVPVGHQEHAPGISWQPGSGRGAYFHSGLHIGATDASNQVLGKGNSRVHVFGGACQ